MKNYFKKSNLIQRSIFPCGRTAKINQILLFLTIFAGNIYSCGNIDQKLFSKVPFSPEKVEEKCTNSQ